MDEITTRIENITDLDSEQLTELAADIHAAYEQAKADGPADDQKGEEFFATLVAFKDGIKAVAARQREIADEDAAAAKMLADLDAEVEAALATEDDVETETVDETPATDEAETPEEPTAEVVELPTDETPAEEPVVEDEDALARAASAAAALKRVGRTRQPEPAEAKVEAPTLIRTFDEGAPIDPGALAGRIRAAVGRYGNLAGREVRVASIALGPDVDRVAQIEDPKSWFDTQLAELRSHRQGIATRQASGSMCAPARTDYTVVALGSEDTPVSSAFPVAGGSEADNAKTLEFAQALGYTQFVDTGSRTFGSDNPDSATQSVLGVGSATATEQAAAGNSSPYPKAALRITCPTLVTCEQRLVWVTLEWDNLTSAAWPELVAGGDKAGRVAVASEMEELALEDWYDAADAADLVLAPQTTGQNFSGSHSYVQALVTAATFDRRAKRDPNAQYVAVVPDWVAPALASEMLAMLDIASGSMSLEQAKAEILSRYGITVIEYLDGFGKSTAARTTSNGVSTELAALTASALTPQFPAEARLGLARDDAAFTRKSLELNLGIFRTETNIENNDWSSFYESAQRTCFRIPPMVLDVRVNASAHTSGSVASVVDNAAGSGS